MAEDDVDLDLDDVAHDFDEDWAEEDLKVKPLAVRLLGERVELPPALPALVVLWFARARAEDGRRAAQPAEIERLVGVLIGRERVKKALESGISFDRLARILYKVVNLYRDRAAAGEGVAPAAAGTESTGSDSSSSTGASSSPTGVASTTEPTSAPSWPQG